MTAYERAVEFATAKHEGQVRDASGKPYIEHPIRVAQSLPPEMGDEVAAAAVLHDVLEDTDTSYPELKEKFGTYVADLVLLLTHEKNESYVEYITKLRKSENVEACTIKLLDIADNLGDSPSAHAISKYGKAIKILIV